MPNPAENADEPRVFVCYSHRDAAPVSEDIAWLQNQGIDLWYDEGISAGGVWRAEIAQAIDACSHFVFFVSAASLESEHCNREVSLALEQSKVIVPIYLEDVTLTDDLRLGLSRVQALWRRQSGYRERLQAVLDQGAVAPALSSSRKPVRRALLAFLGASVLIVAVAIWLSVNPLRQSDKPGETGAGEAGPPLTAIAIMPFEDLSPGGDQSWLAHGITDELFQSLSRVKALRVFGRSSTETQDVANASPAEVGRRLNVGSVVAGSVQRLDEALRVNVQWLRADDQSQLWSARYDRTLDDVFAIQREMATGISEAIRTHFDLEESVFADFSTLRYEPADIRAWQLFQQGIEVLARDQTPQGASEAAAFAREAIAIDPGFARPYSFLALQPWSMRGDRVASLELVDAALARDPGDHFAHRVLASMELTDWNFAAAEQRLERVIAANPSAGHLFAQYVQLLLKTGRLEEALDWAQRRVELEPLVADAHQSLAAARTANGDYPGARDSYEAVIELRNNQAPGARFSQATAYELEGREADALDLFTTLVGPERAEDLRQAYARSGMPGVLLLLTDPASCQAGMVGPAAYFARAGAVNEMFACLEAAPVPSRPIVYDLPYALNASPSLIPYRDDPRFVRLVERTSQQIALAEEAGPIRPLPEVPGRN